MAKRIALVLMLLLVSSFAISTKPTLGNDTLANSWTAKAPMHQARGGLGVISVNNTIYAIGGFKVTDSNGNVAPTNANEQYLPIGYGSPDKSFTTPSPSPTVPELSWLAIIPLMVSILSIAVILRHRKNR